MKKGVFLALLLMLLAAFPALAEGVSVRIVPAGYGQPRYNDHPR